MQGTLTPELSKIFSVSKTTIFNIVNNKTWITALATEGNKK